MLVQSGSKFEFFIIRCSAAARPYARVKDTAKPDLGHPAHCNRLIVYYLCLNWRTWRARRMAATSFDRDLEIPRSPKFWDQWDLWSILILEGAQKIGRRWIDQGKSVRSWLGLDQEQLVDYLGPTLASSSFEELQMYEIGLGDDRSPHQVPSESGSLNDLHD